MRLVIAISYMSLINSLFLGLRQCVRGVLRHHWKLTRSFPVVQQWKKPLRSRAGSLAGADTCSSNRPSTDDSRCSTKCAVQLVTITCRANTSQNATAPTPSATSNTRTCLPADGRRVVGLSGLITSQCLRAASANLLDTRRTSAERRHPVQVLFEALIDLNVF